MLQYVINENFNIGKGIDLVSSGNKPLSMVF